MQHHSGKFQLPMGLGLPVQQLPESGVFPRGLFGLEGLQSQPLVFAAQVLIQREQLAPRHEDIPPTARCHLGGICQPEQGQKQAPDPQFEAGGHLAWQIQSNQRQKHNQT
jgi:hypothetical protein